MLPKLFHPIIEALGETDLTELMGRLLSEERRQLRLRAEQFVYSQQVKAGDEGLDGKAEGIPAGASQFFPDGLSGFQFKAVKGPLSALGIKEEVNKPGSKKVLNDGGTYVLVWNRDRNPAQLAAAEKKLAEEAAAASEVDEPKTAVWACAQIADLCARHPGVLLNMGIWDPGPVWPLSKWLMSLRQEDRPYVADAERKGMLAEIRKRLHESSGGLVLRVAGDSGVGKSRTVAEALDVGEFRDVTFYAQAMDGLDKFLQQVIHTDGAELILVVDEVAADNQQILQNAVDAAGGRIRLVTIGLGHPYRTFAGHRDLQLGALSADAMKELVKGQADVDDSVAAFVAEAAEGYPQMAFEILEEVQRNPGSADLGRLARTQRPQELLNKAVPEELREPLGVLALFHSVGYRDEAEFQLDALAEHFAPTKQEFLRTIENAEGRYVRRAGRRCYVRPKLVATWLAGEVVDQLGDEVITKVNRLPGGLQDAFVQQFEAFGSGSGNFRRIVEKFIRETDRFRDPPSFDKAAGRFLRAAAAVAPQQVTDAISSLVRAASRAELQDMPRRDLVQALGYLLWWPETHELAAEAIFTLALAENESWANNATGTFVEHFQVYLGGTLVPHHDRVEHLRGLLKRNRTDDALVLGAKAAAAGLASHVSRSVSGFRGQIEPRDWQPTTGEELQQARLESWQTLMLCYDWAVGEDARREIVELVGGVARSAVGSALIDQIEMDFQQRDWSAAAKAAFAASLRDVLKYDEPPEAIADQINRLIEHLSGADFDERLRVLFESKPWDLIDDEKHWNQVPSAVRDLGDEVAADPALLESALRIGADAPDEGSRFAFFSYLADSLGAQQIGEAALQHSPPVWAAVGAALARADHQHQADWADALLKQEAERHPEIFPSLVQSAELTSGRAALVVSEISAGRQSGVSFSGLLYGAPIRGLDRDTAMDLIRAVARDDDARALEAAVGMLDQWLEEHAADKEAVIGTAAWLAERAADVERPTAMLEHYVGRLLREVPIGFDQKAAVWVRQIKRSDIGSHHDRQPLINELLEDEPEKTANLIVDTLLDAAIGAYPRWAFSVERMALLSRAARATSAVGVWDRLRRTSDDELRRLMRHFDWRGAEPDSLLAEFLRSERLNALGDEARANFHNSLGVVSGPYYLALERELERARRWQEVLQGTSAAPWLAELVKGFEEWIPREKTREEEEDLFFS